VREEKEQPSNDAKPPSLALEPVAPASSEGESTTVGGEKCPAEAQPEGEPAEPVSDQPTGDAPGRQKNRFAGMVLAVSAVGTLGVLGGVAGAVYVMKTTGVGRPAVAVVALQPQPAMPASAAQGSNPKGDDSHPQQSATGVAASTETLAAAVANVPTPAVSPGAEKVRTVSQAPRGVSYVAHPKTASKAASPAAEPTAVPSKSSVPTGAVPAGTNVATSFNRDSAVAVLGFAASRAPTCKKADGPKGTSKIHVTFDPSGSVIGANVAGGPLAGTSVAQCIAGIFRKIKVPPFSGDRVTLSRDVTIPP
jgi:hypothetical protein